MSGTVSPLRVTGLARLVNSGPPSPPRPGASLTPHLHAAVPSPCPGVSVLSPAASSPCPTFTCSRVQSPPGTVAAAKLCPLDTRAPAVRTRGAAASPPSSSGSWISGEPEGLHSGLVPRGPLCGLGQAGLREPGFPAAPGERPWQWSPRRGGAPGFAFPRPPSGSSARPSRVQFPAGLTRPSWAMTGRCSRTSQPGALLPPGPAPSTMAHSCHHDIPRLLAAPPPGSPWRRASLSPQPTCISGAAT